MSINARSWCEKLDCRIRRSVSVPAGVVAVIGEEDESSGDQEYLGPAVVTVAAGLVGVAVGVALLALLNRHVRGGRGDEASRGDWPDREDANDKTVELIYEHTKDSPSDQLHDSEQLDTKTTAVFAAATVAISLAVRFPKSDHKLRFVTGMLTDDPQYYYLDAVDLCVYLAAVLWALAALATVLVVLTRSFHRTLQADDLYPRYGAHSPEEFKRLLLRDAARAYYKNKPVLKRKARLFNAALYATGSEGLFVVLALVLSR